MVIIDFDYAQKRSYASSQDVCLVKDDYCFHQEDHYHSYTELVYVSEGQGVQIIEGESFKVQAGSIMLFNVNGHHSFYATKEMTMINCCIKYTDNLLHFPSENSLNRVFQLNLIDQIQTEHILYLIELELNNNKYNNMFAVYSLLDILMLIVQRNSINKSHIDPIWGELLQYISMNYATVTLQDAVRICDMSTGHFCRQFKKRFSMTFLEYVNFYRIQKAKEMLQYTKLSVNEIAEKTGYISTYRFFDCFKKFTGTTPLKYRKSSLIFFGNTNDGSQTTNNM